MSARRNGNRARCQHDGCEKFAQTRGLCKAHGGGSRCRDPSCNKLAQSRGLCIAHGGGRRCQHDGCSKLAQSKGFCISHGGGRRCTVPNCEKFSQVKGRCKSHSKVADNSDQEGDDGDDTEPEDRPMASPTQLAHAAAGDHAQRFRIDYLSAPMAAAPRGHEPLPLPPPRSFGLSAGVAPRQPLLPPRAMLPGVGNLENFHQQPTFDPSEQQLHNQHHHQHQHAMGRWEDPHKRVPSLRYPSDDELPPLPYSYNLPPSRAVFEAKPDQSDEGFALPRLARPPSAGALPTVSSMLAGQQDHFVGHKHAEPSVEPTSIPLLSFLNKDASQSTRGASWASTTAAPTSTFSTPSQSGSPPLPSIVLPPLSRSNPNLR